MRKFVNIYSDTIGKNLKTGEFVEICKGAVIGDNVTVGSHTFIPANVVIKDNVFIGQGVMFTNDKFPPSNGEWKKKLPTVVESGVSIGAGSIILPSVTIHEGAMIGAGAVVTKDVGRKQLVKGVPAK
jgi:acetyltransferase-like isoleucine patch superfamily enzyme